MEEYLSKGPCKYYVIRFFLLLDPLPLHIITFHSKKSKKMAGCQLLATPPPPKLDNVILAWSQRSHGVDSYACAEFTNFPAR